MGFQNRRMVACGRSSGQFLVKFQLFIEVLFNGFAHLQPFEGVRIHLTDGITQGDDIIAASKIDILVALLTIDIVNHIAFVNTATT